MNEQYMYKKNKDMMHMENMVKDFVYISKDPVNFKKAAELLNTVSE